MLYLQTPAGRPWAAHLGWYSNSREYGVEALAHAWKWCLKLFRNAPYAQSAWQTLSRCLCLALTRTRVRQREEQMHKHERDPAHHLLANLPWHLLPWLGLTREPWMSQWCSFPAVQGLGPPCPALLREQRVAGLGADVGRERVLLPGAVGCRCPPSCYLLFVPSHGDNLLGRFANSWREIQEKPHKCVDPDALPL